MRIKLKIFIFSFLALFILQAQTVQAEPITAILATLAAISIGSTTLGAIAATAATAAVGAVISFGITALGSLLMKNKRASVGSYSFADQAAGRSQVIRSNVESHKIIYGRAKVSGVLVHVATKDAEDSPLGDRSNGFLYMVIALAGHEIESIDEFYADDDLLDLNADGYAQSGRFYTTYRLSSGAYPYEGNSLARFKYSLGAQDQSAIQWLIDEGVDWTEAHRMRGIPHVAVRLRYNRDRYPNGIPNFSFVVKGKKVFDPRDESTAYSANWALCVLDYITSGNGLYQYGLDANIDTEIDTATFIAAANLSDESVTLADGNTQARYEANGVIDVADKPIEIIKDLLTAGAGTMPYIQGKYHLYGGAYTAPVYTLTTAWMAGEMTVQARMSRKELFNTVKGLYIEPDQEWQPTDFPEVTNSTYVTQDGGFKITRDLELPFTTNSARAQRIAKIALEKSRQGIMVTMPCNLKALVLKPWDTVNLTIAHLGWNAKVFRILSWEFNTDGGITLKMQEESSASYDWSAEETVLDTAPDTNLPNPFDNNPPGNPVVTEELYETINGAGIKTKVTLSWDEPAVGFIIGYIVDFKLTSETEYTSALNVNGTLSTNETFAVLFDMDPGVYDFRIRAVTTLGVTTNGGVTTKEIFGLTAPPADITNFSMSAINNQAHLQWDQATDLDVRVGGSIELRWSSKTSSATWSDGMVIGSNLAGVATNAVVPLLDGTYMIKAKDSGGRLSLNHTAIATNVVNILNMNFVAENEQSGAFPGVKTGMFVDGSTLKLDGSVLFDSFAGLFDDAPSTFDSSGGSGYTTAGTYEFDNGSGLNYTDLGYAQNVRCTADLTALVYDALSLFDSASGNFDDREGTFDGGDISDVTTKFYIATTTDDPSGSPTWSAWQEFVVGDFYCRAFKNKIEVTSGKSSNNIDITGLDVHADVPDRDELFDDESLSSGGTTLTYATPFWSKPKFGITIQGASAGDTALYTHVMSGGRYTGVTVQIIDGGGGVARTVDLIARGY